MTSMKTEQRYISHLKSHYPAVYKDNPYALGAEKDHRVIRKRLLLSIIFTRRKTDEAKKEYKLAKQDAIVRRLKAKAWLLLLAIYSMIPISFVAFILFIGTLPN